MCLYIKYYMYVCLHDMLKLCGIRITNFLTGITHFCMKTGYARLLVTEKLCINNG